jgi:ADP-heptose:LPS heptosyltransferase
VVIAPGATWLAKHWLRERWKELSEQLTASGAEVVVLGNAGEGLDAGLDLTGQTSVMDCARIIAGADVCVCSDSGLMHLSLAVGTPVVALFGPTNPAILVRHDERLHAVTNERECRFCWNDSQEMVEPGVCPRQIVHCLGTIGVESVASEVRNALNGRR